MLSRDNKAQFQGWLSRQVPERLEGNSDMLTDYITALCENAKSGNDLRQELTSELGSMTKPGMDVRDFVGDIMHHVDGGAAAGRGGRGRSRSPPADRRAQGASYSSSGSQGGAPRPFGDPFAAAGHPSAQSSQHGAPHSGGSQDGGRGGAGGAYGAHDSRGRQGGYGGSRDGGNQGGRYAQGQHGGGGGGGGGGGSRSLRVGELPPQLMDLARLSGHFGRYGVVTNIMLQASKRAAYVQMDSAEAAQRALDSREYVCGNSSVRLSWAKHDPHAPRDTPQGARPDAQGIAPAAPAAGAQGGAPVVADAPASALAAPELSAASVIAGDGVGAPVAPPTVDKNTARVLSLVQRKGEELGTIAGMLQRYKEQLAQLKAGGEALSPGDKQALLVQLKATGAEIKRKQAASASALETAKRAAESAAAAAAMDPAEKRAAAMAARGGGRGRGRGGMRGGGHGRAGRSSGGDAADSVEVSDVSDVVAAAAAALAGTGMLKSEAAAQAEHDGQDGDAGGEYYAEEGEGGEDGGEEGYGEDEVQGGADDVVVGDE